jgi:hypothetical protein
MMLTDAVTSSKLLKRNKHTNTFLLFWTFGPLFHHTEVFHIKVKNLDQIYILHSFKFLYEGQFLKK